MGQEENTKAAIDNSGSTEESTYIEDPLEVCNREINRLEELEWTLSKEFLNHPGKEFLALDLWKFLEDYRDVKVDIEHYICHRLEQLRA